MELTCDLEGDVLNDLSGHFLLDEEETYTAYLDTLL